MGTYVMGCDADGACRGPRWPSKWRVTLRAHCVAALGCGATLAGGNPAGLPPHARVATRRFRRGVKRFYNRFATWAGAALQSVAGAVKHMFHVLAGEFLRAPKPGLPHLCNILRAISRVLQALQPVSGSVRRLLTCCRLSLLKGASVTLRPIHWARVPLLNTTGAPSGAVGSERGGSHRLTCS